MPNYRATIRACYVGYIVQAVVVNLSPLLFVPLMSLYGFTYEQMGRLVLINFLTQLATDIVFAKAVDKYGFRLFAILSQAMVCAGFALFAFAPALAADPYIPIAAATVLFSVGGGLLEILISPLVNNVPSDEKASAMSLLHSFYSWGQVAVVILTTLLIRQLGAASWQWIVAAWIAVPLYNLFAFIKAPMPPHSGEAGGTRIRKLLSDRLFIVAILAIVFAGASELNMSQWSSAFMERALHLPKEIGDIAGMCLFAVMMGVGRLIYGRLGSRIKVGRVMMLGTAVAAVCYVTVALSPWPALSLAACAVTGLAVSLLWPGTLVITAERLPLGGATMFALLAAGGDMGASFGPWLVGFVADKMPVLEALFPAEPGLRAGMLISALFPLGMFVCLRIIGGRNNRMETNGSEE